MTVNQTNVSLKSFLDSEESGESEQVLIVLTSPLIKFPNAVIVNKYLEAIKIKIMYLPYNCDFPLDCVIADGQQNE